MEVLKHDFGCRGQLALGAAPTSSKSPAYERVRKAVTQSCVKRNQENKHEGEFRLKATKSVPKLCSSQTLSTLKGGGGGEEIY